VILLSRQGILPGETSEDDLEKDIQELLDASSDDYEYNYSFYHGDEYEITPAVYYFNEKKPTILCKSWVKKKHHQVKKYVKHHKKEIQG